MKGNYQRTIQYLNNAIQLGQADLATDSDNDWTDGAVVDAQVHAGWTYDYFFKRHNRRGLDNHEHRASSASSIRRTQRGLPAVFDGAGLLHQCRSTTATA